jgi:lipoprotein-anchoring transpeptidase ErfK/SrfK
MRQARAKANRAQRWLPVLVFLVTLSAGAQVQPPPKLIVISIPNRKLALLEDGRVLKVYPVAVGAESTPSPSGIFTVVNRLVKPTYYRPGTVIAPGPQNPLGSRWIGLSRKGYGIHGTNAPRSIGKAASHGCIRMAKADLQDLFEIVRVGDVVEIRAEADEETAALFRPVVVVAQAQTLTAGAVGGAQ